MMHIKPIKSAKAVTEPDETKEPVRRFGITTAQAGCLISAIANQVIVDLHDLEHRIEDAELARDISPERVGYGRGVEEHVDLIYSVICTASLVGYRLAGSGPSELPYACNEKEVLARLDRIRAILLPLAATAPSYYRSRRYRPEYVRAMSSLYLALDAIPDGRPDLIRQIMAFSPISQRSRTPQRDAQLWGECVDADL